jgi:DUF4097 and DUF4098 domain-containing protein YvlB
MKKNKSSEFQFILNYRFILYVLIITVSGTTLYAQPNAASAANQLKTEFQSDPIESKFFRVDGAPSLSVFTVNGNIEVNYNPSINGVQVDLYVKREFSLWSGTRSLNNYRIILQQRGNSIVASVEDRRTGSRSWGGDDIQFSFVIQVPQKGSMNLRTMKGDISLDGVEGQHFIQNHSGLLRVRNSEGEIRVASTLGDIELNNIKGNVYAKTVSGDIRSANSTGEIRFRTVSGHVFADKIKGSLIAATTSGDVVSTLQDVSIGVYIESVSGDIDLELPSAGGFTIDANALRYDFDGLDRKHTTERITTRSAKLNVRDGGIPINLSTVSGRIRVKERD